MEAARSMSRAAVRDSSNAADGDEGFGCGQEGHGSSSWEWAEFIKGSCNTWSQKFYGSERHVKKKQAFDNNTGKR